VHQLPAPGFPARGQMLRVVWRSRESLRDLRRAGRPQGRTQGLRHQQGHDPFSSQRGPAACPRAEADQGPDRGERGSKQQSTVTSGFAFAHCTCKSSGMSSTRISRRVNALGAAVYQAPAIFFSGVSSSKPRRALSTRPRAATASGELRASDVGERAVLKEIANRPVQ
jgi:hypothetical protein